MSKRNRPSFQQRSQLPPSQDPDLKTDYVGMVLQVIENQLSGLTEVFRSPLSALTQSLRTSLLIYGIWLGATIFPVWEDPAFLETFPQSLVLIPFVLSFFILLASAFNAPFTPNPRIPRMFWNLFLFSLPFLQEANVSGKKYRPYWSCLTLWVGLILFICAFYLGHFSLGIAAPIILVMGFCSLLFP